MFIFFLPACTQLTYIKWMKTNIDCRLASVKKEVKHESGHRSSQFHGTKLREFISRIKEMRRMQLTGQRTWRNYAYRSIMVVIVIAANAAKKAVIFINRPY